MSEADWRKRFRAPRTSLPAWADQAPERLVYAANHPGRWELVAWDRAAGELVAREAGAVVGGPVDDVPTRDLVWGAAPGLAAVFGDLVRELSARHVGPLD